MEEEGKREREEGDKKKEQVNTGWPAGGL